MTTDAMVKEVTCDSAEAFLDELSPAKGLLWEKTRDSMFSEETWIFRGVPCANSYSLTPSAYRQNAFTPFKEGEVIDPKIDRRLLTASEQRHAEDHFLVQFCTLADYMGIHVPGDRPELRDPRRAIVDYDPHEFPPINKLHMAALAQHYGVPTRLLDWTRLPRVAAYFAVEQVAKTRGGKFVPRPSIKGDEPCAVWALNVGGVERLLRELKPDPTIVFVTAPQATNPNLKAQSGLFTLVQPMGGDPHPLPDIDVVLRGLESSASIKLKKHMPFLIKFVLPAAEARVALRMLAAEHVHAGTVWPGLHGVVDAMKERGAAFQWAGPGRRS